MMRLCLRLMLMIPLVGVVVSASAEAKEAAKITYAIVTGYPSNPAIIDSEGQFTRDYLVSAKSISAHKGVRHAVFAAQLHSSDRVCQSRDAEIRPFGAGYMIIEFNRFSLAASAADGNVYCDGKWDRDGVNAPTLDIYKLGLWAKQAIKKDVVAKTGQADDLLCLKVSAVSCPEPAKRSERFDAFRLWDVSKCKDDAPGCVALTMAFSETLSASMIGSVVLDYEVRWAVDNKTGKRSVIDFKGFQAAPSAPMPAGAPRVVRLLPERI